MDECEGAEGKQESVSVVFSRQCEYALQAVLYLALRPKGELVSMNELTRRLGTPHHFVAKILQNLTNKRLLVSQKGPSGGFALSKAADKISLLEIVKAIDGDEFNTRCVLGFPECGGKNPCAVHDQWAGLREGIFKMMTHKSIAELAREMKKPGYRT